MTPTAKIANHHSMTGKTIHRIQWEGAIVIGRQNTNPNNRNWTPMPGRIFPSIRTQLISQGVVPAVSYTHLRAHETRHDLVCRLLLEKKKNITLLINA